ncbi:phenylpyruvate tautomerase MIF-related protein [Ruminococcus sp. HUN007]|uniref:phenylpyruvate tautomerase MIF-related protein n=1 Tax=Ruminococcus sp. HUN007 TaxID=1514668 RepID=UPI0005D28164|nr:phenylpyruvate tautomerase MIF-related protein [Ruminococcus sp. HUN007]
MPFINVKTNTPVSKDKETALKSALGKAISIIPGKSESWLMVEIEPERKLYFKGTDAPAAMVSVSVFGSADSASFSKLTDSICTILNSELGIDTARTYVKYEATRDWGWNGSNF